MSIGKIFVLIHRFCINDIRFICVEKTRCGQSVFLASWSLVRIRSDRDEMIQSGFLERDQYSSRLCPVTLWIRLISQAFTTDKIILRL